MVLVGQVKARTTSATSKDASTEVAMTLSQEERSGAEAVTDSAVTAVVVSLFTRISKQNVYFVYESELYSRFLPSANKIAILFVKSQKESVLCLRVL